MEVVHSTTGAAVQVGTRGSAEAKRCARLGVCLSGEGPPVQSFIFHSLEIQL